jgi:hypothetical protein
MEVVHGIGGVVDLAENITRAFKDPTLFTKDEEGNYYVCDTDLPFSVGELIDFSQIADVNWDAKEYVEKYADVDIYAGEKDSFGWLTGVIEPNKKPEWTNGKSVCIVYG